MPPQRGGRTNEFFDGDIKLWPGDKTVSGTCLGEDLVELVADGTNEEVVDSEVEVFAALVTDPTGEAPYMVNDEALGLLWLCLLP